MDPSGLQGDRKISFVSYHTRATSINIVRARHACTTQPAKLARDLAYCAVCVFPPHNMRTKGVESIHDVRPGGPDAFTRKATRGAGATASSS